MQKSISTIEEYRSSVDELTQRLAGDKQARAIACEIERLLRFELENGIPSQCGVQAQLQPLDLKRFHRTAIISDIHGNYEGLLSVFDDIERQNCDRIICLGDLVDGGEKNEAVTSCLQDRSIPCVRGNHDEYNDLELSESTQLFLANLPDCIIEDDVLFIHISPRPINRKINHTVEAWNVFDETNYRLIFVGHAHVPYIFGKRSDSYGEATSYQFEYNSPFLLSSEDCFIVCVGAVGYGRDQVGKIRYTIYDRTANTIEHRAIKGTLLPFDYARN